MQKPMHFEIYFLPKSPFLFTLRIVICSLFKVLEFRDNLKYITLKLILNRMDLKIT